MDPLRAQGALPAPRIRPGHAPPRRAASPPGAPAHGREAPPARPTAADEVPEPPARSWTAAALAGLTVLGALGGAAVAPGSTAAAAAAASAVPATPARPAPVSFREAVDRAASPRPHDSAEGRRMRREYAAGHRELDRARDHALVDLARLGEGVHPLPEGELLTLHRGPDGFLSARYLHEDASRQRTVRVHPEDPAVVSLERGDRTTRDTLARRGTRLETRRFGHPSETWEIRGDALVRHTAGGEDEVLGDGELVHRPADGRLATVVAPDRARGEREAVMAARSSLLTPDGRRLPLAPSTLDGLVDALEAYPPEVLRHLEAAGVAWLVADPSQPPPGGFPGGHERWPLDAENREPAGAYYQPAGKVVVLRPDSLHRDTVVHEVAHAVDDAGAPDAGGQVLWESDTTPVLRRLFQEYRERAADPARVWSSYALVNAQEYFAKAFEFYQAGPEERGRLERLDPEMFRYVEGRIRRVAP